MRNTMFIFTLLAGAVSFAAASTAATPKTELKEKSNILLDIDGKIYPNDTFPQSCKDLLHGVKCNEKAFGSYHVEAKQEGDQVYTKATFSDPEMVQVIEQSWEKGGHVSKAIIENTVLKKVSEVEVKDGKVYYKTTDKTDGSVKTSVDDAEENLVVPSTVMAYIRPHNSELAAGKEVKLKVAALDRRESFTFYMKKLRDEKSADGEDVMVLQMTPGSIFVKALVDPMYFYVKPKTGEMFAFEGKSALRRKDGEKYKELVVKSAYQYNVNQYKVADAGKSAACSDDASKTGEMKCVVPGAESNSSSSKQ